MRLEILAKETRDITLSRQRTTKALIRLRGCAGWSAPLLFAYGIRLVFSWPGSIIKFSGQFISKKKENFSQDMKFHIHGKQICFYHIPTLQQTKSCKNKCLESQLTTVMILSFQTDRCRQTVQTQIRLLLSLIRVYTVCNSVCIFWTHYSMVKPPCSNFRLITANFLFVQIFRIFTVKWI